MNKHKLRVPFMLTVMTLSIAVLAFDSVHAQGIISAELWGYGFSLVFAIYAFVAKDNLIKKLVFFGLLAGFAELLADHWLVVYTQSLIYPADEAFIWSSPMYMPFSWTVVLVEFGFIGWLLINKFGTIKSALLLAIAGALLVPLYEHWAISAGWWSYTHAKMIGPVPYYIILAEGLLMLPIPYFALKIDKGTVLTAGLLAVAEGLVMLLACFIAWALLG